MSDNYYDVLPHDIDLPGLLQLKNIAKWAIRKHRIAMVDNDNKSDHLHHLNELQYWRKRLEFINQAIDKMK